MSFRYATVDNVLMTSFLVSRPSEGHHRSDPSPQRRAFQSHKTASCQTMLIKAGYLDCAPLRPLHRSSEELSCNA